VARRFVSDFLLPLVRGGTLAIDRPLSRKTVEALARAHGRGVAGLRRVGSHTPDPIETEAAEALARARYDALVPLVPDAPAPGMDEDTWRLGGAVHDLLALAHPAIATGVGSDARVERVAVEAAALAALGPPATMGVLLARHSLLARLPEVVRLDRTVHYWLGKKTFVGRHPPPRLLALPRVRNVKVDVIRRAWLRDVGVPAAARPAFVALTEASPLGEALDPLRLDPAPSWGRLLSALRFPATCRLVAGHLVEAGLGPVGDALADALYRFVSRQDVSGAYPPTPGTLSFAIGFLAHLVWLDLVFGDGGDARKERDRPSGEVAGRELAVLLAAAERRAPALLRPIDVPPRSDLDARFSQHLARWFDAHRVEESPRWATALEVADLAAGGAPTHSWPSLGDGRTITDAV
jgi:hypothetical protein